MSNPLPSRRNQRSQLLQVAEYTSTAASVVGVVISTLSQQVIYTAAPLSLSLCLNLVNRRRFEQQTQQHLNAAIAHLDQRILDLSTANHPNLTQRVAQIQEQLTAIEQYQNDGTTEQAEVRSQLAQLHEQSTAFQQGQIATGTNLGELQSRFSQLNAQLAPIQQQQTHVVTSQTELEAQFAQVREEFASLASRPIQSLTNSTEHIVQRVIQLNDHLTVLRQRQNDTTADQAEVRAQLSQLHEQLTALQEEQAAITTNQTELQTRSSQLNAELTSIQERQNHATSQAELEAQLAQVRERLSEEIRVVRQQIQATSNLHELEAAQYLLLGFEEQIARLQERLTAVEAAQTIDFSRLDVENRMPAIEPLPILSKPEIALTTDLEVKTAPQTPDAFEDEDLDDLEFLALNLGIDFGTSFTKVCFRDVARDRSEIVTFTDEITYLEEALLSTKIGILSDGTLITGLTDSEWRDENQIQTTVEFIKMRLAEFDLPQGTESWQLERLPGVSTVETVEDLCAYYLSRVIIRAQAWIRRNKPELIINQKIDWSANVGVPVEYYDSPAIARFKKALSLAWLLSNEPQTELMTMQNLHDRLETLRTTLEETAIDCHATPEIAAEVWSLINSREVDEGFYVLFDVGDGTLDGSSFRYWNDEGDKKVDFYSGKVNSLGVTAFSQQLAQELGIAETEVKDTVCANSTEYPDCFQTSTTRKAIQRLVAEVVFEGNQRYGEHGFKLVQRGFRKSLDVLIGGGGGQTSFYTQAITSTHQDFQHGLSGIPTYAVRSLPMPKDLETNGISQREFHRFAVAYGLSIPEGEQPEIRLPSAMEQAKPAPRKDDPMRKPPRYEDMRGA